MWRVVVATVTGYLLWWVIGIAGFLILRNVWHEYALVEPAMAFTLAMRLSRLFVGVVCGLSAGVVGVLIARRQTLAPWIVGGLLLLQFLPTHYLMRARFPAWYHLFFLLTLVPLL